MVIFDMTLCTAGAALSAISLPNNTLCLIRYMPTTKSICRSLALRKCSNLLHSPSVVRMN